MSLMELARRDRIYRNPLLFFTIDFRIVIIIRSFLCYIIWQTPYIVLERAGAPYFV